MLYKKGNILKIIAIALIFFILGILIGYYAILQQTTYVSFKKAGEIKIGVMLPLSGELGSIGSRMLKGALLAAKIINDTGGINGNYIKIIAEDTLALPEKAIEAAKKLIEIEGVKVIIGPATSTEVLAISKYVNDREVVLISMSATAEKISELGDDYVFRVVASDVMQTQAIASIIEEMKYKKIVTFVVANDYGIGLEEGLKKLLGGKIALSIRYDPAKGDYRTELMQVSSINPDAIFYALWVESGIIVFKQALDMGLENIPTLGSEGMADVAFFKDEKAAEYILKTGLTGSKPSSPKGTLGYNIFYEEYKKYFKEEPGLYCDYTYDATMLAALSIAKASAYNGYEIKKALESTSKYYIGATGHKAFDKNGDIILAEYDIWKVSKSIDGEYFFNIIGSWNTVQGLLMKKE
jgi:branched-chain amino acid transport system substrate-binding protein